MKISNKISALIATIALSFGFAVPLTAFAATTPSLGVSATYSILGSTYTNTSAGTTINGDVGFTTGPAVAPLGTHTNYGTGAPYAAAGADQGSALSALASQPCTFTFAGGAVNLSTDTTHGTVSVYAPGVYCGSGAMDVGGPLTLSGSGTFIFRSGGALTTTAGAIVTLDNASACDVFWTPAAATTLAANTAFAGTVISDAGITVGANTTWTGRLLAFGGTVTTDTDIITAPTCAGAPPPPPPPPAPTPTCTLSTNPTTVQTDSSSVLSWTTTNATAFSIDQSIGSVTPVASGSSSVIPLATTVYTGTATGAGGSAICSANVTVTIPPPTTVATTTTAVATTATTTVITTIITPIFAPATVTPGLPNTGFPPRDNSPWTILITVGVFVLVTIATIVLSKRTT